MAAIWPSPCHAFHPLNGTEIRVEPHTIVPIANSANMEKVGQYRKNQSFQKKLGQYKIYANMTSIGQVFSFFFLLAKFVIRMMQADLAIQIVY